MVDCEGSNEYTLVVGPFQHDEQEEEGNYHNDGRKGGCRHAAAEHRIVFRCHHGSCLIDPYSCYC